MNRSCFALLVLVAIAAPALAQTQQNPDDRQRIAVPLPTPATILKSRPNVPAEQHVESGPARGSQLGNKTEVVPNVSGPAAIARRPDPLPATSLVMSPSILRMRISEAERMLKTRPQLTALTSPQIDFVTARGSGSSQRSHTFDHTFERHFSYQRCGSNDDKFAGRPVERAGCSRERS